MPWLWAYWPVIMEARDGQHRGTVAKALVKVRPLSMSRLLSIGIPPKEALSRSSVRIITMFGGAVGVGFGLGAAVGAAEGEPPGLAGLDPPPQEAMRPMLPTIHATHTA